MGIDNRKAVKFQEDYLRKFGDAPVVDGSVGYDLAKILLSAESKEQIIETFSNAPEFKGTFGIWRRSGKNTFTPPLAVRQIEDSEIKQP